MAGGPRNPEERRRILLQVAAAEFETPLVGLEGLVVKIVIQKFHEFVVGLAPSSGEDVGDGPEIGSAALEVPGAVVVVERRPREDVGEDDEKTGKNAENRADRASAVFSGGTGGFPARTGWGGGTHYCRVFDVVQSILSRNVVLSRNNTEIRSRPQIRRRAYTTATKLYRNERGVDTFTESIRTYNPALTSPNLLKTRQKPSTLPATDSGRKSTKQPMRQTINNPHIRCS